MDSTALVLGSILGGIAATYLGLRSAYFLTIPLALLAIIALLKFKEPQLHKSKVAISVKQQIQNTFSAVLQKKQLFPVLMVLITLSTLTYLVFEFSQLWTIALAAPLILFGPINALHLSSIGIGGVVAARFKLHRYLVMMTALLAMVLCSLGLVMSRNLILTMGFITLLCIGFISLTIVFSKLLHDSLVSTVRAGAASAVSTMGRMLIIPIALLFGYISKIVDVFHASWLLVALVLVTAIFINKSYIENKALPELSLDTEDPADVYSK